MLPAEGHEGKGGLSQTNLCASVISGFDFDVQTLCLGGCVVKDSGVESSTERCSDAPFSCRSGDFREYEV